MLHQAGLSSEDAESKFFVPAITGSGGGSVRELHPDEEQVMVSVSLRKPDTLGLPRNIDLMKIDTEGAEFDVVTSLLSRIDCSSPTIIVELLRKWMKPFGTRPQDVLELLSPRGYRPFAIRSDSLAVIDRIDEATIETNFLFVHQDNPAHLAAAASFL